MRLPITLQNKISDFLLLLPNIHDTESQRALLYHAGLDQDLQNQIAIGKSPGQFVQLLITTLVKYGKLADGRYALDAILEAAQNYVGHDKKVYCETILQELHTIYESQPSHAISHTDDIVQGGAILDPATIRVIATTAVSLLTAHLTNATDAAAKQLGDDVYKKLKVRFGDKPSAQEALADLEKNPQDADLQIALRLQVKKLLEEETTFAIELQNMLKKSGKTEADVTIIKQKAGNNAKQIGQVYGNVTFGKD